MIDFKVICSTDLDDIVETINVLNSFRAQCHYASYQPLRVGRRADEFESQCAVLWCEAEQQNYERLQEGTYLFMIKDKANTD